MQSHRCAAPITDVALDDPPTSARDGRRESPRCCLLVRRHDHKPGGHAPLPPAVVTPPAVHAAHLLVLAGAWPAVVSGLNSPGEADRPCDHDCSRQSRSTRWLVAAPGTPSTSRTSMLGVIEVTVGVGVLTGTRRRPGVGARHALRRALLLRGGCARHCLRRCVVGASVPLILPVGIRRGPRCPQVAALAVAVTSDRSLGVERLPRRQLASVVQSCRSSWRSASCSCSVGRRGAS